MLKFTCKKICKEGEQLMQYVLNKDNYRNFAMMQAGKAEGRAYFIPYSSEAALKKTDACTERFKSDKVQVLSGSDWAFKYYDKASLLPAQFDTEQIQFDTISVPSTWQRTGYRPPIYLNSRYEFHLMPPALPEDPAVGVYKKTFTAASAELRYILSFLGVAPCLDVYVNGKTVGYTECSHNTAEFDITKYVHEGENELLCVVHRYCTGTYLECQDMFRETGIFRDVLLYTAEKTDLWDFEVKTKKVESGYDCTVNTQITGDTDGYTLTAKLLDGSREIAKETVSAAAKQTVSFRNLEVEEWNAEIPKVYTLFLTLKKGSKNISVVRCIIGFRTIRVDGEVFKFNGAAIKMKGVNHHDSHPMTGYVLSPADILKDLTLMKEYNVNTIRTSHYPPDPILLTLADEMGFYVIDEADIETHGTCSIGPHKLYKPNLISHDPIWEARYIDRVSRMYLRDRNHPSITMWSLGNEAGGYCNQDACNAYLKKLCPEIPVHYEGAIRTSRVAYDVISEMYTDIDNIIKYRDGTRGDKYKGKPFFLCEYAHAMGVGPGSLEDYWQTFYSSDKLLGGCIWEWCDHAVCHPEENKPFKYTYTYGGDHGEKLHDSNFCVDGLFYPDRTPHTGALEMKTVYRPVRAVKMDATTYKFINTNRFRNADYLTVEWTLCENGKPVESGKLDLNIEPCKEARLQIPASATAHDKDYQLNLTYLDKETGALVAKEQFLLNDIALPYSIDKSKKAVLQNQNGKYIVEAPNCKIVFDQKTGALESYRFKGTEYINITPAGGTTGFVPNVYRAPIDNDAFAWTPKWNRKGLPNVQPTFLHISAKEAENHIKVEAKYRLAIGLRIWYICELEYAIYPDGTVLVEAELEKKLFGARDLPRFGVTIELPKAFSNVQYYGRGEKENMCDFNAHAPVGIYESRVSEMHENYIKPQDNGNHSDTKWLRLYNADGNGIEFLGAPKFSFSVHNYTQALLCDAKHREDVRPQNTTFLSIDGFMRGAGSNACGPDVLEKYRFTFKKELEFKFIFRPISGDTV